MKLKITVVIGTTNPAKIDPAKKIFLHYFPSCNIYGTKVDSGVSEQPMTDTETYKGAFNRALAALESTKDADFGVGIEAGLRKHSYGWVDRMMVVIINRQKQIGIGSSAGIVIPEKIMAGIKKGKTLGQAVDEIFNTKNIGESVGMFGLLTDGVVSRSDAIEQAVTFALVPFRKSELYS